MSEVRCAYGILERTLSISGHDGFKQIVEQASILPNTTYTMSLRYKSSRIVDIERYVNGTNTSVTLQASPDAYRIATVIFTTPDTITSYFSFNIMLRPTNAAIGDFVEFDTTRPFAKLELGSVSTLANDGPVDYGMELAKCQRYLKRINGGNASVYRAVKVGVDSLDFSIPCSSMRTTPAIVGTPVFSISNLSGVTIAGFALSITSYDGASLRLQAQKTAHGLTDASLFITDLTLDANL